MGFEGCSIQRYLGCLERPWFLLTNWVNRQPEGHTLNMGSSFGGCPVYDNLLGKHNSNKFGYGFMVD